MGCTPEPEDAHAPAANSESEAPTNRIDIPPTVRRNLGITFAPVEARRVAQTIRVPGAFELKPRARREYRMALSGRVELLVEQYDHVEAGQPLFRFQSPAWPELLHEILVGEQAMEAARAEIEVGAAKVEEARTMISVLTERLDALAGADFKQADLAAQVAALTASLPRLGAELRLSETHLANAYRTREHALHRASTAADIPEARLDEMVLVGDERVPTYQTIDWIDVRAAVPGVVEMLAVTDGAFVEPPAAVLSTVDPSQVRFRALALQGDLPALTAVVSAGGEAAPSARIVRPRSPGISIGDGVGATMTFGLEAHPRERTLTLIATPEDNPAWIRPGVSAFLEIELNSTDARKLAIPRSAIVQDGLTHVFFLRDPSDPNTAIRVEADMGISDGRWVVLRSGVMRDDEVVLDGAYELKLATQESGSLDSSAGGHMHADGTVHDEH